MELGAGLGVAPALGEDPVEGKYGERGDSVWFQAVSKSSMLSMH